MPKKTQKNEHDIRVMISQTRLKKRVRELGKEISKKYKGKSIVLVGVLKGCILFMSDLARELDLDVSFDFLRVSSYGGGTVSSGSVRFDFDLTQPIRGKHVLLVEDIIDTGLTAQAVMKLLRAKNPASLRLCALLYKPARAQIKTKVDFLGFTIPNEFVIGYGLDYAGRYRNLPHIGILSGVH